MHEITLYYTEAEIAGLEAATGKLRTQFSIYKVNASSYTQANSANTRSLPAAYTAVNGGGTFKATFSTGFSSFTIGFAPAVPNLSPSVSVLPSSLVGTRDIDAVVTIREFNSNPTIGAITVYIAKSSKYVLSFDGAATTVPVSGVVVQNSDWTFDGTSNSGFYILTTKSGIAITANGFSKIGFTSTFNPNNQRGSTVLSVIILDGSGGESNNVDNQNQTVIDFTYAN